MMNATILLRWNSKKSASMSASAQSTKKTQLKSLERVIATEANCDDWSILLV